MKIGVITFHAVNNLGAVLQASSLFEYVRNNICDCEIIDYIPNNALDRRSLVRKIAHRIKITIHHKTASIEEKRNKKFDEYRKQYLSLSKRRFLGDKDLCDTLLDYDIIISGSDQILNVTLTGNSKAYYLDFFDGKKISYASSFGRENISQDEIDLIRRELPKFSALSVREQSAAKIIKSEIGIEPTLVADPVFLLSKEKWSARCNNVIKLPPKYIFVYSMEDSPVVENVVEKIKLESGLPVIIVQGSGKSGLIEGKEDLTCGPKEFLRYLRDAELIITNSFHGTAFSLIFEKKFICVAHSTRNTRLENILSIVNEQSKIINCNIDNAQIASNIIDGSSAVKKIDKLIKSSKEYIESAIN